MSIAGYMSKVRVFTKKLMNTEIIAKPFQVSLRENKCQPFSLLWFVVCSSCSEFIFSITRLTQVNMFSLVSCEDLIFFLSFLRILRTNQTE